MEPEPRRSRLRLAWGAGGAVVAAIVVVALVAGDDGAPADPGAVYDPVAAGEELPDGYRRLLDRDQIAPVYDPQFTVAGAVDWPADSLVIGVAGRDTAKAYPVTHLNRREMVLDELEGTPILVSW